MYDEIKTNYLRLSSKKDGIYIEVCVVNWNGPHTPISDWKVAKRMDSNCSITAMEEAIKAVLSDKKYFRECNSCGALKISGHMYDTGICQSCAQDTLDIVY